MIDKSRIQPLNSKRRAGGGHVLCRIQASQRAGYNPALEFTINQANEGKQPPIVYFGLTEKFPEASERHCYFMLEGLQVVQKDPHKRGIGLVVKRASPATGALSLARKASPVVCD